MLIAGVPSDKKKGGTPGVGSVHLIFGGFPGFLSRRRIYCISTLTRVNIIEISIKVRLVNWRGN
jgi:hypothetical protein